MTKPKITMKRLNVVFDYQTDYGTECGICRKQTRSPSPVDMDTNEYMRTIELEQNITIGFCGHVFHNSCINKHLESNMDCPIDKKQWITKNICSH